MKCLPVSLAAAAVFPLAYAGGHPCEKCHPAETRTQPGTSMALALQRATDSAILKERPSLRVTSNGYAHSFRRDGEVIRYSVEGGGKTFTAVIAWAFGLGSAGQTYLYENGGAWYETRVSFYSAINGLDVTIGHRGLPAQSIEEASGRRLQKSEATRCFGCHASGMPNSVTPGITCERCHENAAQHAQAFTHQRVAVVTPERLGRFDSEQMADFCGACHRTWQEIAANGPHDINNVRLQPYRLLSSKCYESSPSDRRLSCVACHDPHREVERTARFYDAKCQSCHGPGQPNVHTCSKSDRDCVPCHMPKLDLPEAHFSFTDHRIRIVRAGEPYPN